MWKNLDLVFLGAKAPLGIARVKKRHEKVSELNDIVRRAK